MEDYFTICVLVSLVMAFIFGCVAEEIAKTKNKKGFWWGFWLGIIGIIVVACMPYDNISNRTKSYKEKSKYEKLEQLQKLREGHSITEEEFEQEKKKILNS